LHVGAGTISAIALGKQGLQGLGTVMLASAEDGHHDDQEGHEQDLS
jgi:hypothetical protein